jgi:hypothetical protein
MEARSEMLLALLLLALGVAAALTTRIPALRWGLFGGVALSALAWVPLLVVGSLEPESNPIGLGLLALFGTAVGLSVVALGLVGWAVEFVLDVRRDRPR